MTFRQFIRNYGQILGMLVCIVAGCVVGCLWKGANSLQPLGTLFINMMFCIVVPLVFLSISSAIANMQSPGRAGKILATTIVVFLVTATIAGLLTCVTCSFYPLAKTQSLDAGGELQKMVPAAELVINFFTKPDFPDLLSRRALLPLLVFAILFGFGVQMAGGPETQTAKLLKNLTECMMNMVKIVSYYAPIGFFGFFASLVATYGPEILGDYGRSLAICYILCFVYLLVFFPIYAWFGAGIPGVRRMFSHLFSPAVTAFGTCSSVATIPANMEAARKSGISEEVSNVVIPLGATMHMDGSAIAAVLKVIFLLNFFHRDISPSMMVAAILVATISSVAMSGIPGGGGTGELVLCMLFFPDKMAIAFPIALALGNLVDPPATMVNAAGDYVATFIVERFTHGRHWLKE